MAKSDSREPTSGRQILLSAGDYHAEIATVGASLRSLRHGERQLVLPFDAEELRPDMRGALLAPWPNRTGGASYEFDGVTHQLAVNEVTTGHAAHGLVAWLDFVPIAVGRDRAQLVATIQPQAGFPWRLRIDVEFSLTSEGLRLEVTATNQSRADLPFGAGWHPYLLAGEPLPDEVDGWYLELPAREVLLVSRDALLPTKRVLVASSPPDRSLDFRESRSVGSVHLNHAYTGFVRDADGVARVRVTDRAGGGVELEFDERTSWVQAYTTDVPSLGVPRCAIAVEPMTCPPDALNSGHDLVRIPPDDAFTVAWVLRAVIAGGETTAEPPLPPLHRPTERNPQP